MNHSGAFPEESVLNLLNIWKEFSEDKWRNKITDYKIFFIPPFGGRTGNSLLFSLLYFRLSSRTNEEFGRKTKWRTLRARRKRFFIRDGGRTVILNEYFFSWIKAELVLTAFFGFKVFPNILANVNMFGKEKRKMLWSPFSLSRYKCCA